MEQVLKSGILWDLDGTLYENKPEMQQAWVNGFYQAGLDYGLPVDFEMAKKHHDDGFRQYGHSVRLYSRLYGVDEDAFFAIVLKHMDVGKINACQQTRDHLNQQRHHDMAILTSAHRAWALPVLRHIGLDHVFPETHVVAYCDTEGALKSGSEKPFRMAAEVLALNPEQLVMVEDTPTNLVIAKDLGMATVLVTHGAPTPTPPTHVDFVVDKAYDVFNLITQGQIPWQKTNPVKSPYSQR